MILLRVESEFTQHGRFAAAAETQTSATQRQQTRPAKTPSPSSPMQLLMHKREHRTQKTRQHHEL